MESSNDSKKGFFKYVFNFDEDSKSELMNILQFALIGLIPIMILIKILDRYVPDTDDTKGSVEILAEMVVHIICLFIGLFFITRIIMYFPPFSGSDYPKMNVITAVLAVLVGVIINRDSKIEQKMNVLLIRLNELWEGKVADSKKKTKSSSTNVKVSQPISQGQQKFMQPQQTRVYADSTSINSLPTQEFMSGNTMPGNTSMQQSPNFNAMYSQQDNTPLVNAASPGQSNEGFSEPMAASDALGSSWGGFSSW
jgi:hypothetical protein